MDGGREEGGGGPLTHLGCLVGEPEALRVGVGPLVSSGNRATSTPFEK